MAHENEFRMKIEILNHHLGVLTEVVETLVLCLDHDGVYAAAGLKKEIEAISSRAKLVGSHGDRLQLLNQIARSLGEADRWVPPSQRGGAA